MRIASGDREIYIKSIGMDDSWAKLSLQHIDGRRKTISHKTNYRVGSVVYNVFESNECNSLDEINVPRLCDNRDIATQWTTIISNTVLAIQQSPCGHDTAAEMSDCGTEYLDAEAEELSATVCHHLGVMTPAQVRAIRRQAGRLSRAEFSRITGLGEAAIGR